MTNKHEITMPQEHVAAFFLWSSKGTPWIDPGGDGLPELRSGPGQGDQLVGLGKRQGRLRVVRSSEAPPARAKV